MDPISTRVLLGAAGAGAGAENYWGLSFNAGGSTFSGRAVAVDSNDDIVLAGDGPNHIFAAKIDLDGSVYWSDYYYSGATDTTVYRVTVDSSNNYYFANLSSSSTGVGGVSKINSSGVGQSSVRFSGGAYCNALAYSSDGYLYASRSETSVRLNSEYFRINPSNMSLNWYKEISYNGSPYQSGHCDAKSDGTNLYTLTSVATNTGGTSAGLMIDKIVQSTGALSWSRQVSEPSYTTFGGGTDRFSLGVDSSSNVYYCYGISNGIVVGKFNSSGTIQWQKKLTSSSYTGRKSAGIAVDSSGNSYAVLRITLNSNNDHYCLVAKHNSSGTLQWQRTVGISNASYPALEPGDVALNSDENSLYIAAGVNNNAYLIKLPTDGSLTGTYGGYEISSSSLTSSTNSATITNKTFSVNSYSDSFLSHTAGDQSGSFTTSLTSF